MYRIVIMSDNIYAIKISDVSGDADNIATLVEESGGVLLVESLDNVEKWGIDKDSINLVDEEIS
jgi:hypothetical protein